MLWDCQRKIAFRDDFPHIVQEYCTGKGFFVQYERLLFCPKYRIFLAPLSPESTYAILKMTKYRIKEEKKMLVRKLLCVLLSALLLLGLTACGSSAPMETPTEVAIFCNTG